jgi:hypothetical protein
VGSAIRSDKTDISLERGRKMTFPHKLLAWVGESDNWVARPEWDEADTAAIRLVWPESHPYGDKSARVHEIVASDNETDFWALWPGDGHSLRFTTRDAYEAYAEFVPQTSSWAISVLTV